MPPRTQRRALIAKRLICLLNQLQAETGKAMTTVARDIGIESTLPSKLKRNEFRNVSPMTIETATETVGLDPRFFSDPKLGNNPDYRQWRRPAGAATPPAAATKPPKKASKRLKPKKTEPANDAATADDSDEIVRAFDTIYATAEERDAFREVVAMYRFPFINQALVLGIVGGIRKGQRLNRYVDAALNASIDEEMAKAGDDPNNDDGDAD